MRPVARLSGRSRSSLLPTAALPVRGGRARISGVQWRLDGRSLGQTRRAGAPVDTRIKRGRFHRLLTVHYSGSAHTTTIKACLLA
jgi:hypothetical protein